MPIFAPPEICENMEEILRLAARNTERAREIVDRLRLYERWQAAGAEVRAVGSLRMGLLMKHLDIDLHLYTERLDPAVRADLFNSARPIRTKDQSNPSTYYGLEAHASSSLIADGCRVEGEVDHCILFRGVTVEKGARLSHCILMQGTTVGAGATLQYAITDKNVLINPGRMLMGHESYPIAIAKYSQV